MIRKPKFNMDQLLSFAAVVVLLLAVVDVNAMERTELTKSSKSIQIKMFLG